MTKFSSPSSQDIVCCQQTLPPGDQSGVLPSPSPPIRRELPPQPSMWSQRAQVLGTNLKVLGIPAKWPWASCRISLDLNVLIFGIWKWYLSYSITVMINETTQSLWHITPYVAVMVIYIIIWPKMNLLLLILPSWCPSFRFYTHSFLFWDAFAHHFCIRQPSMWWSKAKFKTLLFRGVSLSLSAGMASPTSNKQGHLERHSLNGTYTSVLCFFLNLDDSWGFVFTF